MTMITIAGNYAKPISRPRWHTVGLSIPCIGIRPCRILKVIVGKAGNAISGGLPDHLTLFYVLIAASGHWFCGMGMFVYSSLKVFSICSHYLKLCCALLTCF